MTDAGEIILAFTVAGLRPHQIQHAAGAILPAPDDIQIKSLFIEVWAAGVVIRHQRCRRHQPFKVIIMPLGDKRLPVKLQRQIAREREVAAQRQVVRVRIAKAKNAHGIWRNRQIRELVGPCFLIARSSVIERKINFRPGGRADFGAEKRAPPALAFDIIKVILPKFGNDRLAAVGRELKAGGDIARLAIQPEAA